GRDHVFLGHATAFARAGDAVRVDAVFFGQLARGRRKDGVVARSSRSGSSLGRSRGGGSSRSSGSATFSQLAQQFVGKNGVAFVLDDFGENAIRFGQHLDHHLVGFDVDDQLITLDGLARLLVPGG